MGRFAAQYFYIFASPNSKLRAMGRKLRKIADEVWKEIPYADRRYEISNYGRVKSYCFDREKGKILKPGIIRGFHIVSIRTGGKPRTFLVHKLTAEAFVPRESDDQTVVIHIDGNKGNNYYKNLKWVTREEAYRRMFERYLEEYRKSNKVIRKNAKLRPEDVKLLKSMLRRGIKQNVIAKLFAISEMQVTRIKRNENWSAIEPEEEETSQN